MEEKRCPGCGAPYYGKKCRICLYAPMETDLSRPRKESTSICRPQKRESAGRSLRGFFVILALIAAILPGLRNWGMELDAIDAANRTPEPIPGNSTVLFQQDPITVLVPEAGSSRVSLWFYNHGKEDVVVVCKDITVNGSQIADAALVVNIPAGSAVKGTLPEPAAPADTVAFAMEIQKPNGEFLFETAPIRL